MKIYDRWIRAAMAIGLGLTSAEAHGRQAPRKPSLAQAGAACHRPTRWGRDAREFIVYFDPDRSDLTPESRDVLLEAADYAAARHIRCIFVTGHTDSAGATARNLRLSERRAQAVVNGLQRRGIRASRVSASWNGARDLAVRTGPGVAEPLNRNTTIELGS